MSIVPCKRGQRGEGLGGGVGGEAHEVGEGVGVVRGGGGGALQQLRHRHLRQVVQRERRRRRGGRGAESFWFWALKLGVLGGGLGVEVLHHGGQPHLLLLELHLQLGHDLHLDPGLGGRLVAEAVLGGHVGPPLVRAGDLALAARPPAHAAAVEEAAALPVPAPATLLVQVRLEARGSLLAAARPESSVILKSKFTRIFVLYIFNVFKIFFCVPR